MNFFFDRNIAVGVVKVLRAYDAQNFVQHQDWDNRFCPRTTDVDLIDGVAADDPKPVFVMCDVAQLRKPHERAALARSGMNVVFFRDGFYDLGPHMQTIKLLWVWPSLIRTCERCRVPTAFEIPPKINSDAVQVICQTAQLCR